MFHGFVFGYAARSGITLLRVISALRYCCVVPARRGCVLLSFLPC